MLNKQLTKLVPRKLYTLLDAVYLRAGRIFALAFLQGDTYNCLVCGHSFRKFFAAGYRHGVLQDKKIVGGGYRENAICPYCRSMDRERLVYHFLQSHNLLQANMRVLHIAPERNLQQLILENGADYYAADLDSPMADIKMDIQQIAFADNYFDAIICNHVLEHVPDDIRAMIEMHRVLKPGGWAILQVPFSRIMEHTFEDAAVTTPKERAKVFGQSDHTRIYGLDYAARLRSAGFKVTASKESPEAVKNMC